MEGNADRDGFALLERLAARAREESPQCIPVAAGVLRQLRAPERTPLAWLAAGAAALALLAIVTLGLPGSHEDPLDTVFEAASFVQQDGGF